MTETTTAYMSAIAAFGNAEQWHEWATQHDWVHRGMKMVQGRDYTLRMARTDFGKWR
jgi:hypothetical protein